MEVALLIPCFNEAPTIQKVIRDFRKELPGLKVYVYDNNSTDDTIKKAKQEKAVIGYEFQQGKANVVRRMFREIEADIYIMVDGDDTYPAKSVAQLLEPVKESFYDMVIGDRLSDGSYSNENKRSFHQFGNNLVRFLINKLFKTNVRDVMTGYRVFSRSFVKNYPVLCRGFELETEMTIFALNNNLPIKEIPIKFQERPEGSYSKLNTFGDGFKVLLTIFNLFRHFKPFLFFGTFALITFIGSILVGIPVIYEYIEYKYIYKVPSAILSTGLALIAIISFAVGLILDTISIIDKKNFQVQLNKKNI